MRFLFLSVLTFLLDFRSKKKAEAELKLNEEKPSGSRRLFLHRMNNPGFALGIGERYPHIVSLVTAIGTILVGIRFLLLLPKKGLGVLKAGYALVTGGAFGNLADRIRKGSVTDFLRLRTGVKTIDNKIFNLADTAIVFGGILAFFSSLFSSGSE